MILSINARLKKWCQHADQAIFANFQKSIDDIIQFRRFIWIQFFHNFDHFFFHNDCWTVHQHQIRYVKNITQVSRKWSRKKFIDQKPCFIFKNVINFSSTFFYMFLISVNIFNNSFKTWFLILIYLIRRHNFFYSRHLYQLFFKISKSLFCIWFFVCSRLYENKFFNFFYFMN